SVILLACGLPPPPLSLQQLVNTPSRDRNPHANTYDTLVSVRSVEVPQSVLSRPHPSESTLEAPNHFLAVSLRPSSITSGQHSRLDEVRKPLQPAVAVRPYSGNLPLSPSLSLP
ncbi:unnamed protein product, partial [Ectocarpus sp. 8 AP-2014]